MRTKLFVLREATPTQDARLEYYDNEKKFKKGILKRSITLKTCFSINKKSDCRNRCAVALYTKDDCFAVVCENEQEQEEWLKAMLELGGGAEGEEVQPHFGKYGGGGGQLPGFVLAFPDVLQGEGVQGDVWFAG